MSVELNPIELGQENEPVTDLLNDSNRLITLTGTVQTQKQLTARTCVMHHNVVYNTNEYRQIWKRYLLTIDQ